MILSEDMPLEQRYAAVIAENKRLRALLDAHNIDYSETPLKERIREKGLGSGNAPVADRPTKSSTLVEKAAYCFSVFAGRTDIYACRWENTQTGKHGYSPVCRNAWKKGFCEKPKVKCSECKHSDYSPLTEDVIASHLCGNIVVGIYPMMPDDTCRFLAIDFDRDNWKKDISAVRTVCMENEIPCAVEVSRSTKGAHLWLFFSETVPASDARRLGAQLLTEAMQKNARLDFSSYDRMFPNQDTMPKGGFGNLIALPFQPVSARNGGSLFVDDDFKPWPDQWRYLSGVQRITRKMLDGWLIVPQNRATGQLRDESDYEKPWEQYKKEKKQLLWPEQIYCTEAALLYVPIADMQQSTQNAIKRLTAFRNPEFYRKQAMRMPVWNTPSIIYCASYEGEYLALPRGCRDDLDKLSSGVIKWDDERSSGRRIDVVFSGTLREEQQPAFEALDSHENGILSATTAFGKTVIGAALIASKRVNTLILVHRKQLQQQWKERLDQFLTINEMLPVLQKGRGRRKKREIIGEYGGGRDTRSGIVDIALMQSLGSGETLQPWLAEYGMVIVDECHHIPAVSFEQVIRGIPARFVFGLTATPDRKDGHHPILNMYLGPIRYRVDAKEQADKHPFTHVMMPRFTGTRFSFSIEDKSPEINQYYNQIITDDMRNHLITDDAADCVRQHRNCLLLTERTQHVLVLKTLLEDQGIHVIALTGGKTAAETARQMDELKAFPLDQPLVICATGRYIGEGFDEARLDTMFLAMPISWHGTLAQYAGRLHRLHEGKKEVRIYDYIDSDAPMLERMYHRRLKGYASIGYRVGDAETNAASADMIYDQNSFQQRFFSDIEHAQSSVMIVSPYAAIRRVCWIEQVLSDAIRRGIAVTVETRSPECFRDNARTGAERAVLQLKQLGVSVKTVNAIHQKYAVIDERIVWYGSINLLSFGASQESMMRLCSGSVARALIAAK